MFDTRPTQADRRPAGDPAGAVAWGLRVAAAYGWRLLVVAAASVVLVAALAEVRVVALAVFLALLATALLRPAAQWLVGHAWPPAAAAAAVLSAALAVVAAVLAFVVPRFLGQLDDLARNVRVGVDSAGNWLTDGPPGLSEREVEEYVETLTGEIGANSDALVNGVLSGAQLAGELLVMLALALVVTFFFLKDGDRIAHWFVGLLPRRRQDDAREVGRRCWGALSGYLRGMTIVALFDATFIGLGLVVLGVPAAVPLALLTFAGAYIPIAGAVTAGLVATLVALAAEGPVTAMAVLALVVVVQQVESNFLHPFVVGKAVAVHPLGILLAVAVGGSVAGIIGAFVAVPFVTVAARVGEYVRATAGQPAT